MTKPRGKVYLGNYSFCQTRGNIFNHYLTKSSLTLDCLPFQFAYGYFRFSAWLIVDRRPPSYSEHTPTWNQNDLGA